MLASFYDRCVLSINRNTAKGMMTACMICCRNGELVARGGRISVIASHDYASGKKTRADASLESALRTTDDNSRQEAVG